MAGGKIAIIGGGPGGLMTAHALQKQATTPHEITIFEASDRLGGKIVSGQFTTTPARYEAGAAAEPVNTRVTHRAAAKTSQRLFQALFEPFHAGPHGVGGEPQVDERCEHRHAYLAGAVEDRPAAAAGEPYRELPRGQFLVGDRDVSPRPEPPDCDAGLEFEDDKRGIAAPGRGRLAREPLGQNGVAVPVDPAGQPDRERPGRRGGGAMHGCRLLKPGH